MKLIFEAGGLRGWGPRGGWAEARQSPHWSATCVWHSHHCASPGFAPRCPVSPDPHRPPRLTGSRFAFQIKLRQLTRRSPRLTIFVDGCFWHGCPLHGTQPKHNAKFWREKLARNHARDREV